MVHGLMRVSDRGGGGRGGESRIVHATATPVFFCFSSDKGDLPDDYLPYSSI